MSSFTKIILIIFLSFPGMLKGIAQDLDFTVTQSRQF